MLGTSDKLTTNYQHDTHLPDKQARYYNARNHPDVDGCFFLNHYLRFSFDLHVVFSTDFLSKPVYYHYTRTKRTCLWPSDHNRPLIFNKINTVNVCFGIVS
uniref:Uncharacterized protein n=1 Tax=Sipha flava TaxID=143950 RepID=A0A2S2QRM0_9HEMI